MYVIRIYRTGRKHKNEIPIANKNLDSMGNILNRDASSALKKLQQKNIGSHSRVPGIQKVHINNNNSAENIYNK